MLTSSAVYVQQVRVQQGLPAELAHDSPWAGALGSATGGFYPTIVDVPKKVPAPVVPQEVKQAVAKFKPYFDPAFFPKVCFVTLYSHTARTIAITNQCLMLIAESLKHVSKAQHNYL